MRDTERTSRFSTVKTGSTVCTLNNISVTSTMPRSGLFQSGGHLRVCTMRPGSPAQTQRVSISLDLLGTVAVAPVCCITVINIHHGTRQIVVHLCTVGLVFENLVRYFHLATRNEGTYTTQRHLKWRMITLFLLRYLMGRQYVHSHLAPRLSAASCLLL
jgi:hypothetical protein